MVPPDATVGADITHLEAVGVLERGQCVGHRPGGGLIAGGRGAHVKRLVWPFIVELFTEVIELPLLCAQVGSGRSGGFSFQGAMHPLVAAVLLWFAGFDELR